MIYLKIDLNLQERFLNYFSKHFDVEIVNSDLMLIKSNDIDKFNQLIKDDYIYRYLSRIYFVDSVLDNVSSLKNIVKDDIIRLVCYPKEDENILLEEITKQNVNLSPTEFNKVLFVVKLNNVYYYSLKEKKYFYNKENLDDHIARAYYKIKEIIVSENLDVKNKTILDIGAAPGGWCEYLKDKAKLLIAIDPAELEIKSENIIYFKNKFEDILDKLNDYDYEIIICDVNDEFQKLIKYILKLNYSNKYLIMTLKFSKMSNKKLNEKIEFISNFMKDYADSIKIKWLFANTKHERTLFCKFK
jgi:23S rRNA U2552 (ribose-2'-O)-methylase RlmE/FtsJ